MCVIGLSNKPLIWDRKADWAYIYYLAHCKTLGRLSTNVGRHELISSQLCDNSVKIIAIHTFLFINFPKQVLLILL